MAKKKKKTTNLNPTIATNRKARHDYNILETYECGMVLVGTEVKSLREGKASLVDAFATIDDGEVWLRNLHIPEYSRGHWTNRDGNKTLVPLSLYFKNGHLKCELGLAQGKQAYDKRQDIKRRTEEREIVRDLGRRVKGITG